VKSSWVPVTFSHCFFIFFNFLLFIFYSLDALPCPALPCPYPAPALPGTGGGSYIGNGQCFFFLLLPGTGGGSYPHGRMTVRADSRVTSILIPKTVQNGIKGCFISHPQKNSSKQFKTESRGCFISHPQKFSYIR